MFYDLSHFYLLFDYPANYDPDSLGQDDFYWRSFCPFDHEPVSLPFNFTITVLFHLLGCVSLSFYQQQINHS